MMGALRIDSHKLMYHVERLSNWKGGKPVFPIYAEVGLTGACNHRCAFCAFDYMKYRQFCLDESCLRRFIRQASAGGIKSILYSGEGEPLLYKGITDIVSFTRRSGIDVALVTNGVLLDSSRSRKLLPDLTWIKVSLDAAKRETYAAIHGTIQGDFDKVINNLIETVKIKKRSGSDCAIGVQSLLLPGNLKEMERLARLLKRVGVDYLVIKPYSPHGLSAKKIGLRLRPSGLSNLEKRLLRYAGGNFRVIFRKNAISKIGSSKPYKKCFGPDFATHISASGEVYPCNAFIGKKEFCFGNIYKKAFKDIWFGARRKAVMKLLNKSLDHGLCRDACRLDEINRYLWELKNPVKHANFI